MKFIFSLIIVLSSTSVFSQLNIQQLGHFTYPQNVSASNLTGYADSLGQEYALVGTSQGLSIVDITNPATPVQLFLVPGATGQGGFWREVREYKGYAYVTTEQQSGLQVVNLKYLPDSVKYHTINPSSMETSHTIFIDENGVAYVNGTDKGLLMLDLNANGWNPPVLGDYNLKYVHDCFVRNDTMWAAHINDGVVSVVDVTDKTDADNPVKTLAQFSTPLDFSHNTWLSDDNRYLFTTDEKPSSHLTCYDVSDLNNITETDRTQVNPGSNTIIHNTHFLNNYCITSYYTYGITIHDVLRKNNLVEVGNFDCSPGFTGDGFHGAWGVWPYLPSGNIIISDIETGLWIVKPTYKRAAYLEGVVKDSICNTLLNGVKVEIVGANVEDFSTITGKYSTGTADSGMYTIRYSKAGYQTLEIDSVTLDNGFLTTFNINLVPITTTKLLIKTVDSLTGTPLPFIRVKILGNTGVTIQEIATNATGEYEICDFVQGQYDFYAGRWGRITAYTSRNFSNTADTLFIPIAEGYYDDFVMNYGWTVTSTASKGMWELGEPQGTTYQSLDANPDYDITGDYGADCYVTGNAGGNAGDDDLDNGSTILRSPLFNLTTYSNPYISFYTWFFNDGGQGTTPNDSFTVYLSNGFDTVPLMAVNKDSAQSEWRFHQFRVEDYLFKAINMRLLVTAVDANPGHLVEVAFDKFMVVDSPALNTAVSDLRNDFYVKTYPNPFNKGLSVYCSNLPQDGTLELQDVLGQVVFTKPILDYVTTIPVAQDLESGLYFLNIKSNNKVLQVKKVVKSE
ncbi:MAG: choice-of-anchor B family protein [Bacteroidetes bacterium]|nr:choice-of-anchor B family protein [Bacteroidota bacterium]